MDNIPRISASILAYNQECYIARAIESLLMQKEYLYEIIISDDCSTDKTWDIVVNYAKNYPDLFKLHRNETNLGIFEHIEKTWSYFSGDLVYRLAGDDECPNGWLKTVVEYIQKNQIDYKNECVTIYGDYEARYPNGDSFVFSNDAIKSGIDPVRLSLHGIIGNRSAVYSSRILDCFKAVSVGRSYIAESAQDRQLQLFSKKNYYIPFVGNVYYARIGVSVHFNNEEYKGRENIEEYAREFMESQGYKFNQKDIYFIRYRTESCKKYKDNSLRHRLLIIWLFLKSFDVSLGMKQIRPKRFIFALFRRIPHKKTLSWKV